MESPLISIIIPAYNPGKLIAETIDSVLNQTYQNFEIIIVDDGSTDNTRQIIESFTDKRIKLYSQKNSGLPSIPRNKGVSYAQGEFLAFLDHDDVWKPEKLERQLKIIAQDPSISLVCTNAFKLFNDQKTTIPTLSGKQSGKFDDSYLFPRSFVIQSSVLLKKSVFHDVGGLDEARELKAVEDYDLWIRVYQKNNCYFINDELLYYRIFPESASGGNLKIIERDLNYVKGKFLTYPFSEKIRQIKYSDVVYRLALYQISVKDINYKISLRDCFKKLKSVKTSVLLLISIIPSKIIYWGYNKLRKN